MMEFIVKEVMYAESPLFWTKHTAKYNFIETYKNST